MSTERTFTVQEAARFLQVHPETIKRAIRRGWLKADIDALHLGTPYVITYTQLRDYVAFRYDRVIEQDQLGAGTVTRKSGGFKTVFRS